MKQRSVGYGTMPKKKAMLFGARPFKVMKCASKSTNRRGATSCATKGRRVSRALHDAGSGTGEAESCGKALELSNTTMSSDQLQGKKPNTNVKETMARIYNDIEKESVAVSNDHLNKVEKWAPVLASECMAKFSVIGKLLSSPSLRVDKLTSSRSSDCLSQG